MTVAIRRPASRRLPLPVTTGLSLCIRHPDLRFHRVPLPQRVEGFCLSYVRRLAIAEAQELLS